MTSLELLPGELTREIACRTADRVDVLVRLLDEPDSWDAYLAAMRIGEINAREARPFIEAALGTAQNGANVACFAICLSVIGDERSVPALVSLLGSAEERADEAARKSILPKRASIVRRLVDAISGVIGEEGGPEHDQVVTRQLLTAPAMVALSRLGDKRAIAPIQHYLADTDPYIRQQAAEALQRLESA